MRKCLKRMGLFLAILALIPVESSAQIITKKVSFPKGKSSTVIQGSITGDQTIDYTVGANAGQTLKVTFKQLSKSSFFNVLPPGSENVADFISQTEGNTCSLNLTKSGTYKIRVYQMRSTARRGEKATYSLSISIPAGSSSKSSSTASANTSYSGDAKVAGTKYNATGDLRAKNGTDSAMAKFGVIRFNGGAEIHATIPRGLKRVFVFSKGEWSCKTERCTIVSQKASDIWEIIVNDYEHYFIPDAVIYGG
ncbi:PPC domain-containing protein [Flavobacterium nackdongense]|uniref:Peptidase C-terminal archaeal/bacterial domain-containing protein n=1 Tax=Flavobacterium nackdongense TaxID=2547394 RepID=A0A4P6YAZ1_9FLAO|nr:PPC domain-containing protein [Flavobacterium nackdongense]QBN20321.1 hypothetical protein E1750_16485 [Flavobacterium nackdongense]